MGLRDKTNADSLRKKFLEQKEEKSNKKSGSDKRFLNYFDLAENEKMKIRLLPSGDGSGDYWVSYSTHGPNLKVRGVKPISCAYTSSGEECPACIHSFDLRDDGDKKGAGRWRRKEVFIAQCIVVDSPIEINESEDGNPIKLMYLPFSVKDIIEEAVVERQVDEPMDVEFVLKKTENEGGYAEYNKSYFNFKSDPLDDEIIEAIDNGEIVLHNLSEELPAPASTEEVQEWLQHAIEADDRNRDRKSNLGSPSRSHTDSTDDDKPGEREEKADGATETKKASSSDLLKRLKKNQSKS